MSFTKQTAEILSELDSHAVTLGQALTFQALWWTSAIGRKSLNDRPSPRSEEKASVVLRRIMVQSFRVQSCIGAFLYHGPRLWSGCIV